MLYFQFTLFLSSARSCTCISDMSSRLLTESICSTSARATEWNWQSSGTPCTVSHLDPLWQNWCHRVYELYTMQKFYMNIKHCFKLKCDIFLSKHKSKLEFKAKYSHEQKLFGPSCSEVLAMAVLGIWRLEKWLMGRMSDILIWMQFAQSYTNNASLFIALDLLAHQLLANARLPVPVLLLDLKQTHLVHLHRHHVSCNWQ